MTTKKANNGRAWANTSPQDVARAQSLHLLTFYSMLHLLFRSTNATIHDKDTDRYWDWDCTDVTIPSYLFIYLYRLFLFLRNACSLVQYTQIIWFNITMDNGLLQNKVHPSAVQCPMSCLSWGHWPSLFYWLCGRLKYPAATANHYSELHCFCPPATENYSDSRQVGLGQGGADWWLPRVETPRLGEHSADIGLSQSSPGYLDLALPGLSSLIIVWLLFRLYCLEICVIWKLFRSNCL